MWRQRPYVAQLFTFSYLLQGGLAANWRDNYRPFTYFLPSFILIIFAFGYALHEIWKWVQPRLADRPPTLRYGIMIGAVIIVALIPIYQFNDTYDLRASEQTYGYPLGIWRTTIKTADMGERLASGFDDLPQDTILLTDWEQVTILWYEQQVEGVRPDIEMHYPVEKLDQFADSDRPLCMTRHFPVGEEWHLTNVDALVCLQREPSTTLPDRATAIGTPLYNADGDALIELALIELAGYWMEYPVIEAGSFNQLVLSWQALADLEEDYSISLRVLTDQWEPVWSYDIQSPVMGLYATSRWKAGEVVQDWYEIDVSPDMDPRQYIWGVVVYRVNDDGTFTHLLDSDGNQLIYGGTFTVIDG
jgi:hypothetical protein